jgi:hypothetical protein
MNTEATAMGSLRFADIHTRPTEVLDLTSLTVDEFQLSLPKTLPPVLS